MKQKNEKAGDYLSETEKDNQMNGETVEGGPKRLKEIFDSTKIDRNLIMLHDPQSFEAEQFRMLRTKLLFPHSKEPPQSIMFTSVAPNEGKSFVSLNFAVSIAHSIDKYVLLLDCDLRRLSVHGYLGFGEVAGLSEYLNGVVPLSDLFMKTAVNKLTILPAGSVPPNPSELLSSPKMSELLKEVKSRFSDRFIIIDSPPPKITAESSVIANQVDGIVIVVNYNSTPREKIKELIDTFGKEKVIGLVVNQFDSIRDKFEGETYYRSYQ